MGYDIHGNRLAKGHCEVHPWIAEEYPCYQCLQVQDRYRNEEIERMHYEQREREFYATLEKEQYSERLAKRSVSYRFICWVEVLLKNMLLKIQQKKEIIYNNSFKTTP